MKTKASEETDKYPSLEDMKKAEVLVSICSR
jgi:hypothetical protein